MSSKIEKKGVFVDLSPVVGNIRWLPVATYLFANICLATKTGEVILLLTEERKNANVWVIPGGELSYKNLESFQDAVVREAGKEELGIEFDPEKIELFDIQIGYPIKGSPYEDKGITSVIVSFVYYITAEELANITINKVPEEGCDIVNVIIKPVPDILKAIKEGTINVYPALRATLKKLEEHLKKGN